MRRDMTPEQRKLDNELSAVSMIHSIIAYGYTEGMTAEDLLNRERNSYHNYLEDHEKKLGEKRLLELIQENLDDIDHIDCGVFTDSEGCSYNSIRFKSEVTC